MRLFIRRRQNGHPTVAAVDLGPKNRDARDRRKAAGLLSREARLLVRGDQDRIRIIQVLLQVDNVVGASKSEGIDLKPSRPAGLPVPIERLRGDEEMRSV